MTGPNVRPLHCWFCGVASGDVELLFVSSRGGLCRQSSVPAVSKDSRPYSRRTGSIRLPRRLRLLRTMQWSRGGRLEGYRGKANKGGLSQSFSDQCVSCVRRRRDLTFG